MHIYHTGVYTYFFNSPSFGVAFLPLPEVSEGIYTIPASCWGVTAALSAPEEPSRGGGDVPVAEIHEYYIWTKITVGKTGKKTAASTKPKPGRTNTANPFLPRLCLWFLLSTLLSWASLSGTRLYSWLTYQTKMLGLLLSKAITYFLSEDSGHFKLIV